MAFCEDCPIKGTEYCHMVNPMAKKYTRYEKESLREQMKMNQSAYNKNE